MTKLIILHSALGSTQEFIEIQHLLEEHYEVVLYDLYYKRDLNNPIPDFTIQDLADDFLDFIKENGPAYVYGYSLGGYIALAAAQEDDSNFLGLITQGTQFNWTEEIAENLTKIISLEQLSEKTPHYYNYFKYLHGERFENLINIVTHVALDLGKNPPLSPMKIAKISIPIRLTKGHEDNAATKECNLVIKEFAKNSFYFEIPHFHHSITFLNPKLVARLVDVQIQSCSYQWAETKYGNLAYKEYGSPVDNKQPIILFLHEAIGSIAQWNRFPDELCKATELPGIAVEMPGYGFSDNEEKVRDENYLHEFAWEVIPNFIETINLVNPLIVVGHSDGGTVALLYSSRFGIKTKGIITMAAHYINEPETRAGIQPAIEAYEKGKLIGLELYHGTKTERLFYAWANTWNLPAFKNWDISKDIAYNRIPSLIIQGKNDQYGTDNQVYGIQKLLKNADIKLIDKSGHQPFIDQRETVIETIKEWIEKVLQ